MKKAVIFDMDGLMIDSERVTYIIYCEVMKELGYDFTLDFYKMALGMAKPEEIELYFDLYGDDFPIDLFWKQSHDRLDAKLFENVPLKPGIIELLKYLKANNYKTMVATSSERERVDVILKNGGLISYFDDVICGDEVTQSKPNPEIFLTACKKLKVDPSEALVLEDSEHGIMAAYNANIDVICIPDMKYPGLAYADKPMAILDSLEEVIPYLEGEK